MPISPLKQLEYEAFVKGQIVETCAARLLHD